MTDIDIFTVVRTLNLGNKLASCGVRGTLVTMKKWYINQLGLRYEQLCQQNLFMDVDRPVNNQGYLAVLREGDFVTSGSSQYSGPAVPAECDHFVVPDR